MKKRRDPIVEEVRKYREANAARFGFDVRKIAQDAFSRQARSGHRVVDLSKKSEKIPGRGRARKTRSGKANGSTS